MSNIQIEFNKYGDCILSIPTVDDYNQLKKYIQLKKDQTYNLKIGEKLSDCPKGFRYITKKDNTYIYASKNVYQRCYHIYNGQIFGAICVVEFVCDGRQFICLVKDKFKNTISNPEGSSDYIFDDGINKEIESTYETCLREVYEEIGYKLKNKPIMIGAISTLVEGYGELWNHNSDVYLSKEIITQREFDDILNYHSDEIEQVFMIPSDNLLVDDYSQIPYTINPNHLKFINCYLKEIKIIE